MEHTEKLYHADPYLRESTARVLSVTGDEVVTDRTIFYPEGGGQLGDRGFLADAAVRDTQQRGGELVLRDGLPEVEVATEVVHLMEGDVSNMLHPGDEVELRVDGVHRGRCMRLHSATHLVVGKLADVFGESSFATEGCRIDSSKARIDLRTEDRYGGDFLRELEAAVNAWIEANPPAQMRPIANVPEMFIWHCDIHPCLDMPCGGTHVAQLGEIGRVRLKRKREGRGLERIYIRLEEETR